MSPWEMGVKVTVGCRLELRLRKWTGSRKLRVLILCPGITCCWAAALGTDLCWVRAPGTQMNVSPLMISSRRSRTQKAEEWPAFVQQSSELWAFSADLTTRKRHTKAVLHLLNNLIWGVIFFSYVPIVQQPEPDSLSHSLPLTFHAAIFDPNWGHNQWYLCYRSILTLFSTVLTWYLSSSPLFALGPAKASVLGLVMMYWSHQDSVFPESQR